jgi:ADP-heptose:LPS heptosyltransferase
MRLFVKSVEKLIRAGFIEGLRLLTRREKKIPSDFDFNSSKILCLRQNQIGDTLISTPVFAALKRHYPNITIDVLLDKRNATALDTNPHIRRRHILKKKKFDLFEVLAAVRREHYDCIVDLIHTPSSTSTLFCIFGNGRWTMGFERQNDFIYDEKVAFKKDVRMLRSLSEILALFGIAPDKENLRPEYRLDDASRLFAEQVVSRLPSRLVIGVNISASLKIKFWGVEKFSELILSLQKTFSEATFLILNAKSYQSEAEEISNRSGAFICEETKTLSHFAAVISRVNLLVTPDSAAVHFADVFNIPCAILTHNPREITAWYPSFAASRTVHSENGEVASINVASVCEAVMSLNVGGKTPFSASA